MSVELLTYADVADRYRIPAGTLRWLVHKQRIPHVRWSGRSVRFSLAEIEHWLKARHVDGNASTSPRGDW